MNIITNKKIIIIIIITNNLCFFLVRHQHNADFENRSENDASPAKKKNSVILLARRERDTINQLY